eukprot:683041-Amphidinium_carterae.1
MSQGIIHSTRMALSALGTHADVDLVAGLYQEDWWLRALIARDKRVISHKLFDAHNYQLTVKSSANRKRTKVATRALRPGTLVAEALEAYLDMYVLTGNETYLNAVMGGWEMHRDPVNGWIHVGGSIAINEELKSLISLQLVTFWCGDEERRRAKRTQFGAVGSRVEECQSRKPSTKLGLTTCTHGRQPARRQRSFPQEIDD